jgi:ribosome-binding factor A
VYGTDEERAGTAAALKAATGMLRSEVGRKLNTRLTPTLEFIADALPEEASNIADLLRKAREQDEAVHSLAAGAHYAGDEDPYKHDEEDTDEEE